MDAKTPRDLFACFRQIEDPRMERTRLHRLDDILAMSLMAVIAGAEVKLLFDEAIEKGHGRIETRKVWVTREVDWLRERGDWPGLRSVVCVEATRQVLAPQPPRKPTGGEGRIRTQRRYYISSLDHCQRGQEAAFFAGLIRDHWGVENKLHWSLDVSFNEDQSRVRQGHAAENLSRLRRLTLNLLKQEKQTKLSLPRKRKRAAWRPDYLLTVLGISN